MLTRMHDYLQTLFLVTFDTFPKFIIILITNFYLFMLVSFLADFNPLESPGILISILLKEFVEINLSDKALIDR
jgi:hypothetical protein